MKREFKTFQITLEYNGKAYYGWQSQKGYRTVQGEIERALLLITGKMINLISSGRTDSGVHALHQSACFSVMTYLTAEIFFKSLNAVISNDVIVKSCVRVVNDFHARLHAKLKTYKYNIISDSNLSVMECQSVWRIEKKLNFVLMIIGTFHFLGTHDFKAFQRNNNIIHDNSVRTITKSYFKCNEEKKFIYVIQANGFLRFMVRNIVGTLVEIGLGIIKPEFINNILDYRDRNFAGRTAPSCGLYLINVNY